MPWEITINVGMCIFKYTHTLHTIFPKVVRNEIISLSVKRKNVLCGHLKIFFSFRNNSKRQDFTLTELIRLISRHEQQTQYRLFSSYKGLRKITQNQ